MKFLLIAWLILLGSSTALAAPQTLDEILDEVLEAHELDKRTGEEQEKRFLEARDKQKELLAAAKNDLAKEIARGERLRKQYQETQAAISEQSESFRQNLGELEELHALVRQIAGEVKRTLESSLISAHKPKRTERLEILSQSKELPALKDLENLWRLIVEEIVESGRVVKFKARIAASDGAEQESQVTRVGVFNIVAGGQYLRYVPETGQLVAPSGQPSPRLQRLAENLEGSTSGVALMPLDPTRGALLALLIEAPTLTERLRQGGLIGYLILGLGAMALFIVAERFAVLASIHRKMRRQRNSPMASSDNPLGRLRLVERNNPIDHPDTLELKLDQAIMKEIPRIWRLLPTLAVFATAAPLLGLLGTVAGMIETFQSMTLFGAGDPKLVAGGISLALVATELGLLVAIPILLLHSLLHGLSNRIIHTLEEEIAAIVARREEQSSSARHEVRGEGPPPSPSPLVRGREEVGVRSEESLHVVVR